MIRHQAAFWWYTTIFIFGVISITVTVSERSTGKYADLWWLPLFVAALTAYMFTRMVRTAKKDWDKP